MKKTKQKNTISEYLTEIMRKNPKICSGRKNYSFFNYRLLKNIELIKKFNKHNKE